MWNVSKAHAPHILFIIDGSCLLVNLEKNNLARELFVKLFVKCVEN
jgi:hypothetical protein